MTLQHAEFTEDNSFSKYAAMTKIKEGNEDASAKVMLADLLESHGQVVKALKQVEVAADKHTDAGTMNMVDARIEAHQKNIWMLRVTLSQ